MKRAPFSPELQKHRDCLARLLPKLEAVPGWYGSIYLERKSSETLRVDLKQTLISDQSTLGVVFRIYDGYTLFEQATDELDEAELNRTVTEFANRVASTPAPAGATQRLYEPQTWGQRLTSRHETELTSQLPALLTAQTQVHFGIGFTQDPASVTTEQRIAALKKWIENCQRLAPEQGFAPGEVTFLLGSQTSAVEESVFLDRESNMSQTLYRQALTQVIMSGGDRTFHRTGGLGGMELVELTDTQTVELLGDLKQLKSAKRLHPGKYRVLLGPVLTGVLAHEAFGHSQEGDTCARGRSKAWDLYKSGESVGNQHATILNNPALFANGATGSAGWGSYFFDEEGWLAQEQVLLDQGKLQPPMTNFTSALRLGVPRTANGKRESWANGVYTRQTNTYFSAGTRTYDQLLSQIEDGFLATTPAGGMEDPKGMGIQVGIGYLKEVKGGKLTGRVFKGPAGGEIQMTGYVPDVLNQIVDKSKIQYESAEPDTVNHPFNDAGGCGKYHKELVYAGCGGPFVLLDQVMLG